MKMLLKMLLLDFDNWSAKLLDCEFNWRGQISRICFRFVFVEKMKIEGMQCAVTGARPKLRAVNCAWPAASLPG